MIFSKTWLKDTAERALASGAEAVLAVATVGAIVDVETVTAWLALFGTAAGYAVLKSVVAAGLPGSKGSASLVSLPATGRHARPE